MVPSNQTFITGQGQVDGDALNTFVQTANTMADLRSFIGVPTMQVSVLGQNTVADGNGGAFYWSATATGPDDNINVIIPLGASSGGWLRSIPSFGLPTVLSAPFPTSFGSTPTDMFSVNIGSYPSSAEIPAGVLHAIVGKVVVPRGYTQAPWPNAAVAGYMLSDNITAANTSLAFFGFSGQLASNVDPYGWNIVLSNGPTVTLADGEGFDGNWVGGEIDFNIFKKTGGATPTGRAYGFLATGGSSVTPSNGTFAYVINNFGPGIPWNNGFISLDGAAGVALNVGAVATGNSQNSQEIVFHSKGPSGLDVTAIMNTNPGGSLLLSVPAGQNLSTNGNLGLSGQVSGPPGTPPSDTYIIYVDNADNKLKAIASTGFVTTVASTS